MKQPSTAECCKSLPEVFALCAQSVLAVISGSNFCSRYERCVRSYLLHVWLSCDLVCIHSDSHGMPGTNSKVEFALVLWVVTIK